MNSDLETMFQEVLTGQIPTLWAKKAGFEIRLVLFILDKKAGFINRVSTDWPEFSNPRQSPTRLLNRSEATSTIS